MKREYRNEKNFGGWTLWLINGKKLIYPFYYIRL